MTAVKESAGLVMEPENRAALHRGDMVYVDGKLEGILGRVTEVNYNSK